MANIVPNSTVTLYKNIPVTNGQNLAFSSKEGRDAYFNSNIFKSNVACSYIRKQRRIKLQISQSDAIQANYLSFINTGFENIRYYARITDTEYINNVTTAITYSIDYWMTYMFQLTFGSGVVEREQLSDALWTKAQNKPAFSCKDDYQMISAEDFNLTKDSEIIYNLSQATDGIFYPTLSGANPPGSEDELCVLLQIAHTITESDAVSKTSDIVVKTVLAACDGFSDLSGNTFLGGCPQSVIYAYINFNRNEVPSHTLNGQSRFFKIIDYLTLHNALDIIITRTLVPRYLLQGNLKWFASSFTDEDLIISTRNETPISVQALHVDIPSPTDGLHPKVFMYPFRKIRVINRDGDVAEYQYEKFNSDDPIFSAYLQFIGQVTYSFHPENYKIGSIEHNWINRLDYKITAELPYNTNQYLTYLANVYNQVKKRPATLGGFVSNLFSGVSTFSANVGTIRNYGEAAYENSRGNGAGNNTINSTGLVSLAAGGVGTIASNIDDIFLTKETFAAGSREEAANSMLINVAESATAENYVPGSIDFLEFLYNNYQPYRFTILFVRYRDAIVEKISKQLMLTGCNTMRHGTPLIANYVSGETDPDKIPHFVSVDGEPLSTYVSMSDCKILNLPADVASNIENMFNGGCRFIKGESLL